MTAKGQRALARSDGITYACAALIPALAVGGVLSSLGTDRGTMRVVAALIIAGCALGAYFKVMFNSAYVCNHLQWLDFLDRTWRSAKEYTDERLPTESQSVPFADMVLVCHDTSIEESISFRVDLCRYEDLGEYAPRQWEFMRILFHTDDVEPARDFALKLSELWSIDCWIYERYDEGGLQRIFAAPTPPKA